MWTVGLNAEIKLRFQNFSGAVWTGPEQRRVREEFDISSSFNRVSHLPLFHASIFFLFCQCKDGYGGDGEECEIDPDLDGIPSFGLSCTLPNCYKVRNIFCTMK